ncbi:optic atrophy 3 protein homolog [Fopius arisanus]|uniref:CG13601 protein n=1 Tax=Fopius arisanus TaxID=64838 RepID=A0A0C9RAN8_9HYME|nr:PREDICTED: optic atrophy 3 protein homolog [Fopius arisanus]XP_011312964.1 PREDICTED: optic atrophy 3 protein homolog [Fopius arisanus]XP_011312965.1 PREDICTED: optic atrophy 3 protein homolog [Fopius arisanus]XP_011312966.1 PREDICTED: optic atrophy 3 protein homolog [Fopius arisanus]
MAVGVFPALKLGVLFMKQISKPLAKVIVTNAKNHPVFRNYFIIPPAQFYHWAEVKAKMYLMNLGKPTKVAKLNEQMAIELGASLMGEVIIFTVAGGCLILEYNRQVAKEARKEGDRQAQLQKFADDITNLHQLSQQQAKQLEYLTHVIEEIAKKTKHKINLQEVKSSSYLADSSDSTKEHSRNSVNNVSIKKNNADDSDDKSVVRRAIVYYENDVKGKFS